MIWFTSDWHLGHKNIEKYEPSRGPDHNERIWNNYVLKVGKQDTCFFLGDISFLPAGRTAELFRMLPGYKILIKGNHDRRSDSFYMDECKFDVVHPLFFPFFTGHGLWLLSHYPLTNIDTRYAERVRRINEEFVESNADANVHGHTHSNMSPDPRCFNVCVEAQEFAPVSERALALQIAGRLAR